MGCTSHFDIDCRRCRRLAGFLAEIRAHHPDYHGRPVPSFGAARARIFIVGLAPGLHGANRTGRPFTGDYAGKLLYETLYRNGLSNRPVSEHAGDRLRLRGCRIVNAVKCVPPQNKPVGAEIRNCNGYLASELGELPRGGVALALGVIAHGAVLRALELRANSYPFAHASEHRLPDGRWLVDSYHCSRYNTQTRRLSVEMFHEVVARASRLAMAD